MKIKSLERSEEAECAALVEYLDILKRQQKVVSYTHIPNETFTLSWNQKRKNKAMGVSRGFPDYVILLQDKILFVEMKREKNYSTSIEQKFWIADLNKYDSSFAMICHGFVEAKDFLDEMLR